MARSATFEPSFHAKVTRNLLTQYEEAKARWIRTMANARRLHIKVEEVKLPSNPLIDVLLHAHRKAKHCKCGSLHCASCGFIKLHQRAARIEQRNIAKAGYLSGGRVNF